MKLHLDISECKNMIVLDITTFTFSGVTEGYDMDDVKSFNIITVKPIEDIDEVINKLKVNSKINEKTFAERIYRTEKGELKIKVRSGDKGYRDPIFFQITE